MAIKINVSHKDQKDINGILEKVGYSRQKRKYHCTIGFIEKKIPEEELILFGQKIIQGLQAFIEPLPLIYEVKKVDHLFGHVIAFLPTPRSLASLNEINLWLFDKVKEISDGRWELNKETVPPNYNPHLTLWRTHRLDHRFQSLNAVVEGHLFYHLSEAACVIF